MPVDLLLVLLELRKGATEQDLDVVHAAQALDRHVGELVLLGLHHVRIRGFVLQSLEVEFGDQRARRAIPELEGARDQAAARWRGRRGASHGPRPPPPRCVAHRPT